MIKRINQQPFELFQRAFDISRMQFHFDRPISSLTTLNMENIFVIAEIKKKSFWGERYDFGSLVCM